MYVDTQTTFSDNQAVTATAISANVIDLGAVTVGGAGTPFNPLQDVGTGEPVTLVVLTTVAATDAGSDATLTVTLESALDAGLTSSPVVHFSTGALPFASFSPAGARVALVVLPTANYQRYVGLRYTVAAGPLTAGAFKAFLTTDPQANFAFASNFVAA
jgi:hypothetical protein